MIENLLYSKSKLNKHSFIKWLLLQMKINKFINKMSQYQKTLSSIGTTILSRIYLEGNNHHTFSKRNVYSICK